MLRNNPNLNLANMNVYTKSGQILSFVLKILSGNKIQTYIKGRNCVTNFQIMTINNPNLDLVNVKVYTKFGQVLFNRS